MEDEEIDPEKKYKTESCGDLLKNKEYRNIGRRLVWEIRSIKHHHFDSDDPRPYLTGKELLALDQKYDFDVRPKDDGLVLLLDNTPALEVRVLKKKKTNPYQKRGIDGGYYLLKPKYGRFR